ncbi:MAG: hypothetical protein M4D80_08650 [Myxococcota bacterium]|nr:hypothetical protein [Deltaproteobacteria bacterium]MDQ3335218.1 hypothetical protein [Myxococcota bacterium]
MQEREITSRICLDELQGLLDTEEPATKQRTTAEMPAVTLEGLLQPEEPPPVSVQVTFRSKRATSGHILPRPPTPSSGTPTLPGTTRRAAMGTPPPISIAGLGATDDFSEEDEASSRDGRETVRLTGRDTIRMAAAGVLGIVNGVPVTVAVSGYDSGAVVATGSNPAIRPPSGSIDAVIDAAVDAAIDAEIHNAEIDAAIDAVVFAPPTMMTKQRYGIVAMSFALSFVAGIIIMFMLG